MATKTHGQSGGLNFCLKAKEEDVQSQDGGQGFVELQQAGEDADTESGYDDGEKTSSSFWETDRVDSLRDEATSYGKERDCYKADLVRLKPPCCVLDNRMVGNVNEEHVDTSNDANLDMHVKVVCGTILMTMLMEVAMKHAVVIDWGFDDVVGEMDGESQVLVNKAPAGEMDGESHVLVNKALAKIQVKRELSLLQEQVMDVQDVQKLSFAVEKQVNSIVEEQVCSIAKEEGLQRCGIIQAFKKRRDRAIVPTEEDKDDVIENKFLSTLAEYDAAAEQMLKEQVIEADKQVVLIDLEGLLDKEELEVARIKCMASKEESIEPKMELPMLQVCSMTGGGDSQVGAKRFKEFFVNDDVHSESGDAFGGVFLEVGSLLMDAESSESMLMAAYVDGWQDTQDSILGKVFNLVLTQLKTNLYERIVHNLLADGVDDLGLLEDALLSRGAMVEANGGDYPWSESVI
ncbi:hypothetical protein L7F22_066020 [Adiantum nelumboides]|nr:hypothetical protein [Adiantum nelumboides]